MGAWRRLASALQGAQLVLAMAACAGGGDSLAIDPGGGGADRPFEIGLDYGVAPDGPAFDDGRADATPADGAVETHGADSLDAMDAAIDPVVGDVAVPEAAGDDQAPDDAGPPGCEERLTFRSLMLDGIDNREDVTPGKAVTAVAMFRISNPPDCAGCRRQVVLGVEDRPDGCVDAGVPATCPQVSEGAGGLVLQAPAVPGTWNVTAYDAAAEACGTAMDAFLMDPAGRVAVGVLTVAGECGPGQCPPPGCLARSCDDLGKECGSWGDGCGRPQDCGTCPGGWTCSPWGRCEGPCEDGVLQPGIIRLNGGGAVASSPPGAAVDAHIEMLIGGPDDCVDCPARVVLAVGGEAVWCREAGLLPACPDAIEVVYEGTFTAPFSPGEHAVELAMAAGPGDCADGGAGVLAQASKRVKVGSLVVHAGCQPLPCPQLGRECGPADDGCGAAIECGACDAGLLCTAGGQCGCEDADPCEPNEEPVSAFDLGQTTDSDAASARVLTGALAAGEADWFVLAVEDKAMALVDPWVRVAPGLPVPFRLAVAWVCADGGTAAIDPAATCGPAAKVDLGALGEHPGMTCESTGHPVEVSFGPSCTLADDSGTVYIGVEASGGGCSAYELSLHM